MVEDKDLTGDLSSVSKTSVKKNKIHQLYETKFGLILPSHGLVTNKNTCETHTSTFYPVINQIKIVLTTTATSEETDQNTYRLGLLSSLQM